MSRPKESEPIRKRCLTVSPSSVMTSPTCPGVRSRLAASNSVGATVPRYGAAIEMMISRKSAEAPMRTAPFLKIVLITDPRVEEDVRQIHQQVDHYVHEREEQDQ